MGILNNSIKTEKPPRLFKCPRNTSPYIQSIISQIKGKKNNEKQSFQK